ncbi:GNAT family N-acetyltransferase [Pseudofulvibacter geojedonensis]|uniref:GNAT family N-acetyltransferase n=1 Tax=Pseudofulvibacter geojedonensis TaxID=1123758 RepID=A0ABW3I6T3_9FLAO
MSFKIRKAVLKDLPAVLDLIQELATFENEPKAVEVTVEELQTDYAKNLFSCIVAVSDNKIVGLALYYNRYSTWKGKTIHLEDLVVTQTHRGKGIGKALLNVIIAEAKKEGVRRVEWCVLDWNANAINFYESTGATILKDWYLVQLDKKGIENF